MGAGRFDPALLDRLLDGAPALVVALNRDGTFAAVNQAWTTLLGWPTEELLGKPWSVVTYPDDLAASSARIKSSWAGKATGSFINRIRTKAGGYRWIQWTSPENQPPVGISIGFDLTGERDALRAAEEATERLRSVLETAPGYISIVNRDGELQYINRTYPGIEREQVIGTNLINWIAPESREAMQRALDRALAGEQVEPVVNIGTGPDGGLTWYRTAFGAVRNADGEVIAVTLYGDDITAQMRAERARAQAGRFEAVGRVAAAVGHDFNNVLTAMQAGLQLVAREVGGPSEGLELLEKAIDHASELTGNLRKTVGETRQDAGALELTVAIRDLEALLRNAAGELALEIALPDGELHVQLDAHELSRILVNLVANAREAITGKGSVRVSLEEREVGPRAVNLGPGSHAVIEVRDDGPGIPAERRARVFDPFFTTKPSGSGFGLAICYGLVRARGGDIEIICPPSGGTTVSVWIPITDRRPVTAEVAPAPAPVSESARPAVILLAEDEHLVRSALARYLARSGHIVLEARDGEDALEVASRHPRPIDVLVTDLAMPRRGGIELIRELRKIQPDVGVLAMSGHVEPDEVSTLDAMGVEIMPKPMTPTLLDEAIARLLKG